MGRNHPYRPDLNMKPPPTIIVVGATWPQVNTIQSKMYELCDKSQLADGCEFDEARGVFVGKYPRIRLKNGGMAIFTAAKGAIISIAGLTIDAAWVDEPLSNPRLYSELWRRVGRKAGDLYMTFTPVNANVDWLKEECEAGQIHDLHFPINDENLRFVDNNEHITLADGTPCDAAWLESEISTCLEYEVPVIFGGEWEFRANGALWKHYRDSGAETHVIDRDALPDRDWKVCLGIDHGDRAFAACASLVLVENAGDGQPTVVVLDEWHSDGSTTSREDARAILAMVQKNLTGGWSDLDVAFGDIPHSGTKRGQGRKNNRQLSAALAMEMGQPGEALPTPIKTVRKPPGSVSWGHRFIHNAMLAEGAFSVLEHCEMSRHCLLTFDGRPNSPESHQIDAIRYALNEEIVRGGWKARSGPTVYVY